jgi:hypothetical protein
MEYRDRVAESSRLVEAYAMFIAPRAAESLRTQIRCGEPALAVEELASWLVRGRIALAAGDAMAFRRLLRGYELCPDTGPDIADRLLFGAGPPGGYSFDFHDESDPAAVASAVAEVFAVPRDRIRVLVNDRSSPESAEEPIALVSQSPGSIGFEAGTEFGTHVGGASVLDVAKALCAAMGSGAMLRPRGLDLNERVYVSAAGGHGVVVLDGAETEPRRWILFACEPISGAPDLRLFGFDA